MFAPHRHYPRPPGAGTTKIADPKFILTGWVVFLVLAALLVLILWPYGLGANVDRIRRQFVAVSYLSSATALADGDHVARGQALRDLNLAVREAPNYPLIADNAAQLYVNLRAYRQAIPWLERQHDRSLLTSVSLGQCLLMVGRKQEGERLLQRAMVEAQTLARTPGTPPELYALVMNNVGYVYALADIHLNEAEDLTKHAMAAQPLEPAFVDSVGWVQYQLGNYLDAAFYLERAVRLYLPHENAEVYYHLGSAYARLGRVRQARWALERCLALDDSWQQAREELRQLSLGLPAPAIAWQVQQGSLRKSWG